MSSRNCTGNSGENDAALQDASLLRRIRSMWQFANLCQWIYIFGKAAKIDESVCIEDLELECLKPASRSLSEIALALLKLVSSQRGLTLETLDEHLRKLYSAKYLWGKPFRDDDDPVSFAQLDVFNKIKTLQALTQLAMIYPERLRERMEEQKDTEQTSWRIEPYGWDKYDRTYFVLDDNRIYRFTEPSETVDRLKTAKSRQQRKGHRLSKRLRSNPSPEIAEDSNDGHVAASGNDGLGDGSWECVAVTLDEVQVFLTTLKNTQDANEKILRRQLEKHLVPILLKQEEAARRKEVQRERELLNLARLANAKRSSRIADKLEKQKQDEEEQEKQRQILEAETADHRQKLAQMKAEQERDFRTFSRQRRLQQREAKRLQHEDVLMQLSGPKNDLEDRRISQRRQQAEIRRSQQALQDIAIEEESWMFDCVCGLQGQTDDGNHSVACERCNVWQHSRCLNIEQEEADQPQFHFVCLPCRRQEQERGPVSTKLTESSTQLSHSVCNPKERAIIGSESGEDVKDGDRSASQSIARPPLPQVLTHEITDCVSSMAMSSSPVQDSK